MSELKISFEDAMQELESIVEALEKGEMPLEAMLSAYERGIALKNYLDKLLDAGEKRIMMLNGEELIPFTQEEE